MHSLSARPTQWSPIRHHTTLLLVKCGAELSSALNRIMERNQAGLVRKRCADLFWPDAGQFGLSGLAQHQPSTEVAEHERYHICRSRYRINSGDAGVVTLRS